MGQLLFQNKDNNIRVYHQVCHSTCKFVCNSSLHRPSVVGRHNSVGTATRYGPDGPGIKYWWWGRRHQVSPSLLYHGHGVSFPGLKRLGRGFDHLPHLATRLKTEWSYTSIPLLGLRALFLGELYLFMNRLWPKVAKERSAGMLHGWPVARSDLSPEIWDQLRWQFFRVCPQPLPSNGNPCLI